MKSFVYTVVAATIAASSAVANTTDASTSGTVPAYDQTNFCEFRDVTDGTMTYSPGYSRDTLANGATQQRAGFWKTDVHGEAIMKIRTRGAYKISVLGGTVVKNKNDGTEYPVLVDLSTPNPSIPSLLPQLNAVNKTAVQTVYVEPLEGVAAGRFGMGGIYGQGYMENNYRTVYTSKDQPDWGDDDTNPHWGFGNKLYNPDVIQPEEWINSQHSPEIHDQVNFYLKYTNFALYAGEVLPNLVHDVQIAIQGVAWMLDSNGKVKYEDDGKGRRIGQRPSDPNGTHALSYYGMTDGDYYIEHTVQCIQ